MLAHVGSVVPSSELVAQNYPLSVVLEDEVGQVRGGLFGSITYQSAFLIDPLADNSRDPFEDFAALLYPAEQARVAAFATSLANAAANVRRSTDHTSQGED